MMKQNGLVLFLMVLAVWGLCLQAVTWAGRQYATGVVFHDRNQNQSLDRGEKGLKDIRVSNGKDIVRTDKEGRYRIAVDDDTIVFVIKPRGWMTPVNGVQLPQFYYIHKPSGSPEYRYAGISPTGSLPDSIDFPLYPRKEPERFRVILFGDTQPRNVKEVEYIAHDVVEEIIGTDALFGVTLGDVVFDDLSVFAPLNETIALAGIPWYNVPGNHDSNYDAPDDTLSSETFKSVFGPNYYSYDCGPVHFLVLDDIQWHGKTPERKGHYTAGLGEKQMEFVRNDLALVPQNQLVVLMMHIPLMEAEDRAELYRLIEKRPYAFSISAHTHQQQHFFLTQEDGWLGSKPHHHFNSGTVCGGWWSGVPDERGIPHATMFDGAPNGYSILTFDGHDYSIEFKAAGRPADYQMNIFAPEEIVSGDAASTEVCVNVFAGSKRSTVEMRFGEEGAWVSMKRRRQVDPYYAAMKKLEEGPNLPPGRKLPGATESSHLWTAVLPGRLCPGTHLIHVRTTDMFGKTYTDQRAIRVR